MKKVLVIVRREFLMAIEQKAYLVSMILFPLLILVIGGMQMLSIGRLNSRSDTTIGVVDRAGVIDFGATETIAGSEMPPNDNDDAIDAANYRIVPYEEMRVALHDVQNGKLGLLCVVAEDYLERGAVEVYARDRASLRQTHEPEVVAIGNLLRANLLRSRVAAETVNRVLTPMNIVQLAVTEEGEVIQERSEQEKLVSRIVPISLAAVLSLWIIISSRFMLVATLEENSNRVMEVMLSSVKPDQLIWGKVIGLGGVALLQVMVYLGVVGFAKSTVWAFLDIPLTTLALCLAYCIAGYLFFVGLMTAAGVTGWGRSAGLLTLTVWIPSILGEVLASEPNGSLARVLSFIPFTSAMTMVLRLNLTDLPPIEVLGSLVVLIGSVYLTLRGGVKIFRTASLMYGKRVSLPEITRWLREA